jgi:hypothetical protein
MENAVPSGVSNARLPSGAEYPPFGRSMEGNGAIMKMSVPFVPPHLLPHLRKTNLSDFSLE